MPSLLGQAYTDLDDLFTKWFAFAVTNGWTQDLLDTAVGVGGSGAIHKGTVFASWTWNTSQARLYHFQALGYDSSPPGGNPDDAGPDIGGPSFQTNGRATIIGNGAGTADFFQGTESGSEFLVCVAETDGVDLYRMWMLGELIKVGDWTGGEFVSAQSWPEHNSFAASQDNAFDARNRTLIDALHEQGNQSDTLHMEGVHSQPVGQKWGAIGSSGGGGDDRSGTARAVLEGGARDGPWFHSLNWLTVQPTNGFIPLLPYPVHYRSGGQWTLLGFVPGIRGLRITFIAPREEFTLGADTWKAYPWVKKSFANSGGPESDDQGLAFLKTP